MIATLTVSLSIALQLTTALLAVRLIKPTGWRLAWSLLAGSLFVMGIRRGVLLYTSVTQDLEVSLMHEFVVLAVSIAMVAGIALIGPALASGRRAENRLHLVIEAVPALISYVDKNLRYQLNNRLCKDWWGKKPEEIKGRLLQDVLAKDTFAFVAPYAERALGGEAVRFETNYASPDKVRELEVSYVPDFTDAGEVQGFFEMALDITQRKQAIRALEESRQRYRAVVEEQTELICRFRPDGALTFVNEAYCRYFGKDRETFLGKSFFDLIPEEDRAFVRQKLAEMANTGRSKTYEHRVLSKDGEERWQQWSDRPLYDAKGVISEFQSVGRDITDRKRVEESLSQSEAKLRLLIDSMPALISYVDRDLRYQISSKLYEDWFGVPRDAIEGRPIEALWGSTQLKRLMPYTERALRGERVRHEVALTIGGVKRDLERTLIPHFGEDGEVLGFFVLSIDISERKIAERKLRLAKEEAESADAAKTRFLAAASHDLRQPLHAMRLLVRALERETEPPRRRKLLSDINLGVQSMGSMLNALLDVSQVDSGRLVPSSGAFRIDRLLEPIAARVLTQAEEEGLTFHWVPCGLMVTSDPALLGRIIDNFLDNALRHTHTGKILLGCRRRGSRLRIEVWDTGVGIPDDKTEMIFEEYYQLSNPARDRSKGLGLGLALVERLARLLDCPIEVRSELGKGSLFAVEVPIADSEDCAPKDVRNVAVAESPPECRVLLVEDDRLALEATTHLLELWGYQVRTALDGRAAMDILNGRAELFDFVLADYRLPRGETGLQVIARVRSALGHDIPGLVITGDVSRAIVEDAERARCGVIHKPIDPTLLQSFLSDR